MGYTLGLGPLDAVVGEVPTGSNIIIIGPPMSKKSDVAKILMHQALERDEGVIYISTNDTGEKLLDWFEDNALDLEPYGDRFGIVDCVSASVNVGIAGPIHPSIRQVNGPMDMAGMTIEVTDLLNTLWRKQNKSKVWIIVDSLSIILMYAKLPTVFRFLHVLTSTVRKIDAMGVFIVEDGMHDEQSMVTIKQLVQGIVEVRKDSDAKAMRVVGLITTPSEWSKYNVQNGRIQFSEGGP